MKYKKLWSVAVVFAAAGMLLPAMSSAAQFPGMYCADASDAVSCLQGQVNTLLTYINQLEARIEKLEGGTTKPAPAPEPIPIPRAAPAPTSEPAPATPSSAQEKTVAPQTTQKPAAAPITSNAPLATGPSTGPGVPANCVSYTAYGVCVPFDTNSLQNNTDKSVPTTPTKNTKGGAAPPIGPVSAIGSSILSQGASGNEVRVIQELLRAVGSFTYPSSTGYFGSATEHAVKNFQSENGLQPTGIVDRLTLQKMEAAAKRAAPSLLQKVKTMLGK